MSEDEGPSEAVDLRERLQAERSTLLDRISRLQAEADDEAWVQPKPDEADQGAAAVERERLRSLAGQARDSLHQVEQAITRLDKGTFGKCTDCGGSISAARLEARPEAEFCLTCQQRHR